MFPFLLKVTPVLKQESSTTIIVGIIIIFAFILLLVISGKVSSQKSGANVTGKSGGKKAVFSSSAFKKRCSGLALTKTQTNTLENLIKTYHFRQPYSIFSNPSQLDMLLQKAINDIENQVSSDEIKESQKLTIFRIKQTIERNSQKKQVFSGTNQMKLSQNLVLTAESGDRYHSKVTSNLRDLLGVQIPVDLHGNQLRWKKWTKVKVFFWKQNGQGYSFQTKVSGYNLVKGVASLFLQHSKTIHQAQQRRFRRKSINKPAYLYPVRIITTGTGKNQQKKAYVDNKSGSLGTIIEVSSGGCSLKSTYPLGAGELIKIEFEIVRNRQITVFGKVKSIKRIKPLGGTMHIMFTKVSGKNLNKINTFVYDF